MIVVKIELWPYGFEENKQELYNMVIANDGITTLRDRTRGSYNVFLLRKGKAVDSIFEGTLPLRRGSVQDFARKSKPAWELVKRAFNAL